MKKIEQFQREETGEEWLRELFKVVARRRAVMFRLISETTRMLLLGNGGGAALVIGFMSTQPEAESAAYHWISLVALSLFGIGVLASAMTIILVAMVAVREAHSSETGLKQFVDGDIDRSEVMFVVEEPAFRIADYATGCGLLSALTFLLGGLTALLLLTVFF